MFYGLSHQLARLFNAEFDHSFSVVYLSLRAPQLIENELDMMCIRSGNYVRSSLLSWQY